jgi:hypothetical protein
MIAVGIASFLLVVSVAYLVGKPFLVREDVGRREAAQLREDHARLLAHLRDLEMEFSTGKLAEDEYRTQRAARAADIDAVETALAELERGGGTGDDAGPVTDDAGLDADEADRALERRIETRRRALESAACPRCGAATEADDRFCLACGVALAPVETR